jgi:2-polyprenyl-3-methyl-5-hydroxy-6-metoxy-1,4-benzoquinol methylase
MNEIVRNYGWTSDKTPPSVRVIFPALMKSLRARGSRRIVDIGCGNGALTAMIAGAGFEVLGVDADARGIEIARRSFPQVRFEQFCLGPAAAVAIPQIFPRCDTVVSIEVIEHLFRPLDLIQCASAILSPSGTLILSTPYHGYVKNLALALLDRWDRHWNPAREGGHIKFWSPRTLTTFLQSNGFSVEGFVGVGRLPWLWHSMVMTAQRQNGP